MTARSTARQPTLPGLASTGRVKGQLRQATGRDAEKAFEAAHDAAHRAGLVSPWWRGDPGIRKGPDGRAVFRPSAALDYFAGIKTPAMYGRLLAIEVKSCDGDRWPYDHLAPEQACALDEAHAAGGLALVIIVRGHVLHPVPWQLSDAGLRAGWRCWHRAERGKTPGTRLKTGLASLPFDLIAPWAVPPGQTYLSKHLETRP